MWENTGWKSQKKINGRYRPLLSDLFYQRNGHPDLRCHSAKPDREKFALPRPRTAFLSGDRKFMFKLGISGILWMMSQKTAVVVLAVPYPVCLFLFLQWDFRSRCFLCDDLPDRNHEGHDHDHHQSCGPSGDGKFQSISESASYVVCGGGFPVPIRYDAPMGAGMNWKTILRLLAVLHGFIVLSYATM